jgi:hypothetical protein
MPTSNPSVLNTWTQTLLRALEIATGKKELGMGPPMVARALAIVYAAAFQAWGTYDATARAPAPGGHPKQPPDEAAAGLAVSYAVYRAAEALFPNPEVIGVLNDQMSALGLDITDSAVTGNTPAAVGNQAAAAALAYRLHDGANQTGQEPFSPPLVSKSAKPPPYTDTTGYAPVNASVFVGAPTRRHHIADVGRWQPLAYVDPATAQTVTPGFIAPHWGRVRPFALSHGAQFRPSAPAEVWTQAFMDQARYVIDVQKNLTTEQKVIAEYWADGPKSWLPPGHWCEIGMQVSTQRHHGLADDAKMFFALSHAILDASIATWEAKVYYDYCRPVTAIRWLFDGIAIPSWAGPAGGIVMRDGAEWRPFQKDTFPTPPFAEFTSGHSAFSMAAATVLRLFTGSDLFSLSHVQDHPLAAEPGLDVVGLTLHWNSFTSAAMSAGESRLFGGIHFHEGNVAGLDMGRQVGLAVWERAQRYF